MTKQKIIDYYKSKNYKYWVLKIEDFINALTEDEIQAFNEMLGKNEEYRISTNRTPSNSYWIVNRDDTPIDNLKDFFKAIGAEHCLEKNNKPK